MKLLNREQAVVKFPVMSRAQGNKIINVIYFGNKGVFWEIADCCLVRYFYMTVISANNTRGR